MHADVIVVGGGPAGIMAAGTASNPKSKVILIEKNNKLGKKLSITGNGRCNLTNISDVQDMINYFIPTNPEFLYSCLNNFTNYDLMNFFSQRGLKLKQEDQGKIFPATDNSSDIINVLKLFLSQKKVLVMLNTRVIKILSQNKRIEGILTDKGDFISCNKLILATGGKSYPKTGSNGDGFMLSQQLGHSIVKPKPALVPIITRNIYTKDLQGISLKNVLIKVLKNTQTIFKTTGEIIFTHFGISGPAILNASSYITKEIGTGELKLCIDFIPSADEIIINTLSLKSKQSIKNSLSYLIPKRLVKVLLNYANLNEHDTWQSINLKQKRNLLNKIHNFKLDILGTKQFNHAMITSGGIYTKEINPYTMQSKLIKNLYFAGEIIDVDALTGGYNLQIAFSTGYTAGKSCAKN